MQIKSFSQSCENNKNPIFSILAPQMENVSHVLEIGSGTGQHATFFTRQLPHVTWQTTDQGEYFVQLKALIEKQNSVSLPSPLELDVSQPIWPIRECQLIFTANTLHIMPWFCVEKLFHGIKKVLQRAGSFYIYGPFNYAGEYTSVSNEAFDLYLKSNNTLSGIRDFEEIIYLAEQAELELVVDHEMPANNRLLHFRKK